MRLVTALPAIIVVLAFGSGCGAQSAALTAAQVAPDPRAGALFVGDTEVHTCSASVLHSSTGDLVLTAAHCVANGVGATFVPGLGTDAHERPGWQVDDVYLDDRWIGDRDPRADYAIARVSRPDGATIESVVGAGFTLAHSPAPGTTVAVTGYAFGEDAQPIGCRAPTQRTGDGFPVLECDGMVAGTSGSPWVAGDAVTGVTGGLDGGGCDDDVSYSPPFDGRVSALLARAEAGGPGDDAPEVADDC